MNMAESAPQLVTDVPPRPTRAIDAHKHSTGRVGILAGGPGMSGAAVLCGLGALRGGAGTRGGLQGNGAKGASGAPP